MYVKIGVIKRQKIFRTLHFLFFIKTRRTEEKKWGYLKGQVIYKDERYLRQLLFSYLGFVL